MKGKDATYTIPIYRLELVKEAEAEARTISNHHDVVSQMTELARSDREAVVCLMLNTRNRPIGRHTVSIGTLDQAAFSGRELFKAVLLRNAHKIILIHNHPSGDVDPSVEDDRITVQIARAGRLLGIPLLDHVIVGPDGSSYSYRDQKPFLLEGGDQK